MTAAKRDDDLADAHAYVTEHAIDLLEMVQTHRKRDELVVAAAMAVMERGSATSGATTLARVILGLYEGSPVP